MGLSLRRGLEGATGSLLGAGVKALGELFFAAGFEAECAGNGVGDDLGSWVALALEASDLRWKKPRMDFWLEAGVCFLPLADGLGVDIVGRQWCTQWTKVGGEDDAGGFGCDVDEVARPGGDAQMAGGARRDRVSLGPSFRSLHSPTPSSCNHNRCHVNFHTKLLVTQQETASPDTSRTDTATFVTAFESLQQSSGYTCHQPVQASVFWWMLQLTAICGFYHFAQPGYN